MTPEGLAIALKLFFGLAVLVLLFIPLPGRVRSFGEPNSPRPVPPPLPPASRPGMVWKDRPYGRWVAVEDIEDRPRSAGIIRQMLAESEDDGSTQPVETVP